MSRELSFSSHCQNKHSLYLIATQVQSDLPLTVAEITAFFTIEGECYMQELTVHQ